MLWECGGQAKPSLKRGAGGQSPPGPSLGCFCSYIAANERQISLNFFPCVYIAYLCADFYHYGTIRLIGLSISSLSLMTSILLNSM